MILLFVHGWGFDAGVWSRLLSLLPDCEHQIRDRGYFGRPEKPAPEAPCIAVAHSFGAMQMLATPPAQCRGLIAINGFDRFAAHGDLPGVAPRVLDRMIDRFAADPSAVVAEFRRRCGNDEPFGKPDTGLLRADLEALRDDDRSAASARWELPLLAIQGGADPILPEALRETVFAGAGLLQRETVPSAGHLLPLTDPSYCANAVRKFLERTT